MWTRNVFSMFHFYCIVMYIDVRFSHPNKDYLLTYNKSNARSLERKGKERKGKERKGKERKGKERKGKRVFI